MDRKKSDALFADAEVRINPFRVMEVMHRASELEAEGREIVHMEVGEPDFVTAEPIREAAKRALDAGHTRYTSAAGIPALRQALSDHYAAHYDCAVPPGRIFITPGASAGLMLLAHLLVRPGQGVLLGDPAYPCVRNFIRLVHGRPQLIPVGMAENFQPTVDSLKRHSTDSSCGVWVASPANPTGTILDRRRLGQISEFTRSRGLHLLVDEIYHGLHYVSDLPSILEIDQQSFVVNSFSKYFGMTGWRLGWIVVPDEYIQRANILAQNLFISAPSIAQHAALTALSAETRVILEQRRQAFRERRDYLGKALRELGFRFADEVQGAFYIYADISSHADDAEAFCRQMLDEQGVAFTPGTDFGEFNSQQFVRFAFTTSMEQLELGVSRLRTALA